MYELITTHLSSETLREEVREGRRRWEEVGGGFKVPGSRGPEVQKSRGPQVGYGHPKSPFSRSFTLKKVHLVIINS